MGWGRREPTLDDQVSGLVNRHGHMAVAAALGRRCGGFVTIRYGEAIGGGVMLDHGELDLGLVREEADRRAVECTVTPPIVFHETFDTSPPVPFGTERYGAREP